MSFTAPWQIYEIYFVTIAAINIEIVENTAHIESRQRNGSLLYRALYNLVENAIRYNEKEGSITIDLKNQDTAGMVKIADTGVGIAPEARELIFEPFYRVNKSRSRRDGCC